MTTSKSETEKAGDKEPSPEHNHASDWSLRPARDLGLGVLSRKKSTLRETNVIEFGIRALWWLVARIILRLWNNLSVEGRENLPQQLPFVLVANHSSHMDVMVLTLTVPLAHRAKLFALAAEDYFFTKVSTTLFASTFLNALPMARSGQGKGREGIQFFRDRLTQDQCGILVFPEGTRSRNGVMGRFRSGIGNLVAGTSVPVVPCYIDGSFKAFPSDGKILRRCPVTVRIGTPLTFEDVEPTKEGCEQVAAALEAAVAQLRP